MKTNLMKCDQYTILSNTTTLKNKTENSNLEDRTQKNWFKKRKKKKRVLLITQYSYFGLTLTHSLCHFTFPSLPRKTLPLVYGHCHCTLNPKPLHHHPSLSSPLQPKPKSSNNLMQKTTTLFMDLPSCTSTSLILPLIVLLATSQGVLSATFTFVNKCDYTIWPGILANAGSPRLDSTGFELPQDSSRSFVAPTGWSGRFWGRTRCNFYGSGSGSCLTGDCGSGQVECNGLGAAPPATLAEFTLGSGGQDFYDVSLVDGYNLPMIVESSGGSGLCSTTGCSTDVNRQCPAELRVGEGDACKSACEAFGSAEYCCSGAFNTPATCKPSVYSQVFKSACPKSYSYAYDDATSTFTCTGADYTVTFCPSSSPSQKSSSYSTPVAGATSQQQGAGSGLEYSADGSGSGYPGSGAGTGTGTVTGSGSASGDAMLADGSYLAGLAMGDSTRTASISALQISLVAFAAFSSFVFSFGYL